MKYFYNINFYTLDISKIMLNNLKFKSENMNKIFIINNDEYDYLINNEDTEFDIILKNGHSYKFKFYYNIANIFKLNRHFRLIGNKK